MQIRETTLDDISAIIKIAEINDINNISTKQAEEKGFMVPEFTKEEYEDFVERDYVSFFVSIENNKVVGYILAYPSEYIDPEHELNSHIKNNHCNDFLLIKQISVHPNDMSKGYGTKLYQHLFGQTDKKPAYVAVVMEPRNDRSNKFHEKIGFKKAFEYMHSDGRKRLILRREP